MRMYKNKDLEQSKKYNNRKNEIITYRLLLLLAVTVAAVVFFVCAINFSIAPLAPISFAGLIITGILFIAAGIFFIRGILSGIDESDKILHSKNIFAVAAAYFFAFVLIFFTGQKLIPFLTAVAICATILGYLYYLYQREFFWFSLFTAAGSFIFYFAETQILSDNFRMLFRILLAVGAVVIIAFAVSLMKNKGHFKFGSVNIKVLEHNAKYFQFFIIAAFIAAFAVLGFISLAMALAFFDFFYLLYAILACFIIVGIYFTVKII